MIAQVRDWHEQDRNSFICAHWLKSDAGSIDTSAPCRPGCVQFYMKHNVMLEKNNKHFTETFYLAYVRWYKQHPEKAHFRSPNTVWYPDHVDLSESSFIPISRIATRCAQKELELFVPDRPHHSEKAILICPLSMNSSTIL